MVEKRVKIIWDNEAKEALRSIYEYIKSKESIEVASKVGNEIFTQAKSLSVFLKNLKRNIIYRMN